MIDSLLPRPHIIKLRNEKSAEDFGKFKEWMNNLGIETSHQDLLPGLNTFVNDLSGLGLSLKNENIIRSEKYSEILGTNQIVAFWNIEAEETSHSALLQSCIKKYDDYSQKVQKDTILTNELIEKEGYILSVDKEGIFIISQEPRGCYNGLQTIFQAIKWCSVNQTPLFEGDIFDFPEIDKRAFHLDLKDLMPTFDYIKALIKDLAHYKYNCITIEYEDKFPFHDYLKPIVHKDAWKEFEFREIMDLCKENFIEIIPLIQVFGHVEFIIEKEEFQHLQETPDGKPINLVDTYEVWSLCPLHEESEKLARALVDQMVEAHPDSEYLHIGADEVYQLGTCPKCREYLKTHTKSELYIEFINKIANYILEKGKKPIMWHDYLLKYPENLDQLNKDIVIMYWIYKTWRNENFSKDEEEAGKILPQFEFFHEKGFKTMGAPSISSDFDLLIPNLRSRIENIAGQSIRAKESGSLGLLITSWVCCANPMDTQLIGIYLGSEMMWAPPSDWNSDSFDWEHYDQSIQTQIFQIVAEKTINCLKSLFTASERRRNIYPNDEAIEQIPKSTANLNKLKSLAKENHQVIDSMLMALEFLTFISDTFGNLTTLIEIFKPYSESEEQTALFPTMDFLFELSDKFHGLEKKFNGYLDKAEKYYIEDVKQIVPGQWAIINAMDRYNVAEWLVNLDKNFAQLTEILDKTIMDILRQEMEFNF